MFCNFCGKNIQDDARLCAYCGRLVIGMTAPKRLERSRTDRKIAGVAGGMARYWATDPTLVRLLWIFALLATGPVALLAYVIAWIVIPEEPEIVFAMPPSVVQTPQG
jgi:phage shock protein C